LVSAEIAYCFVLILLQKSVVDSFAITFELDNEGVETHVLKSRGMGRQEEQRLCQRFNQQLPTIGIGVSVGAVGRWFRHSQDYAGVGRYRYRRRCWNLLDPDSEKIFAFKL